MISPSDWEKAADQMASMDPMFLVQLNESQERVKMIKAMTTLTAIFGFLVLFVFIPLTVLAWRAAF